MFSFLVNTTYGGKATIYFSVWLLLHKFDKQYLIVLQWNSTCIAVNIFWTSGDYAFEKKKKSWPRGHACMSSVEYVENIFLYITWNSMMFDKWMQECCLFMGKFSFVAVCLSLPMPDFLQAWNDGTKKLWARPSCSTHLQGGLMLGRQIRYQRHHKNFIFEFHSEKDPSIKTLRRRLCFSLV